MAGHSWSSSRNSTTTTASNTSNTSSSTRALPNSGSSNLTAHHQGPAKQAMATQSTVEGPSAPKAQVNGLHRSANCPSAGAAQGARVRSISQQYPQINFAEPQAIVLTAPQSTSVPSIDLQRPTSSSSANTPDAEPVASTEPATQTAPCRATHGLFPKLHIADQLRVNRNRPILRIDTALQPKKKSVSPTTAHRTSRFVEQMSTNHNPPNASPTEAPQPKPTKPASPSPTAQKAPKPPKIVIPDGGLRARFRKWAKGERATIKFSTKENLDVPPPLRVHGVKDMNLLYPGKYADLRPRDFLVSAVLPESAPWRDDVWVASTTNLHQFYPGKPEYARGSK